MKAFDGKRILMLVENSSFPGDPRVRQESISLVSAGYQVVVITPKKNDQPSKELFNGIHVYRYPTPHRGNSFLGYLWEYGYAMTMTFFLSVIVFFREGFDVVHAHNPPDTFVFIAIVYKLLGKRFVFDHHDLSPELYYYARFGDRGNPLVYKTLMMLEKITFKSADHVISTNESYKKIAKERGQVPEEQITIVRNGPDLNRLRVPLADQRTHSQTDLITICFVGSMGHHDGVDYLLRAIKYLIEDLNRSDFLCLLVGGGDAWPGLKFLAKELDVVDYVSFTGHVDYTEVASYISASDICVAPEPSNNYNDRSTMIKLMEYMALGKPIVAFDLPEHRVTAGDAAVYVRPNNEMEFARHINMLMNNPERRQEMGEIGKKHIKRELMWPHQEKQLLRVYEILT